MTMLRFVDVVNDYLAIAVARIGGAVEALTGYPVYYAPPEVYQPAGITTQWFVGCNGLATNDVANDDGTQTYSVFSQLIYKPDQSKYDPAIYLAMYTRLPQVYNYFESHKRLVFEDTQTPIKHLQDDLVTVTLVQISQGGQPGFALLHRLPFRVWMQQE